MSFLKPTISLFAIVFSGCFLLSGCTMQISEKEDNPLSAANTLPVEIQMQRLHSYPEGGSLVIPATEMAAGDILLTSPYGPTSLGIRLFSASTVSHAAIYLGNDQVVEAVGGSGVQIVSLDKVMDHNSKIIVLRVPELSAEQALAIRHFSESQVGQRYNYNGVALMAPFMMTRQLCSLNPFSEKFRNGCISTLAKLQLGSDEDAKGSFFCSQFVIEAYNQAGLPITTSDPVWVSPVDLLHMRQGDVASLTPNNPLLYIGHLKKGIIESTTASIRNGFSAK
ncbi:YaeF family permuted papain-like enzyme [Limnobaculum parvum]|uniref:YaeF family permuted papain-like enzyme n=1 Tax=Limnobaculum parvum TaxID=2172103 RepID=A0A2Y9TVD7_9GAMM|nr:YaeF family permuted papain-like enzyme [Limnobaculum parvum]AWH87489.1 YaeF family permuted papain-like enzyme [Limnobaculum parvum]